MRRTLDNYIRHAERHGTEQVFEAAAGLTWPYRADLSLRELGYLSLRLQNLDSTWRLPKGENDQPIREPTDAYRLVDPPCDFCRRAQVDWRRRRELPEPSTVCRDCRVACAAVLGVPELSVRKPGPAMAPGGFEVRRLDGADFALMLISEGVDEKTACRMAMVSRRTVQRRQRPARELLEQAASNTIQGREAAFQSGEIATNRGAEGDWSSGTVLSLWGHA